MKNTRKVLGIVLVVMLLALAMSISAFATAATTEDELKSAVENGGEVVLGADLSNLDLTISKDTVLDLGGNTLTDAYIIVSAKVTVKNGSINNTTEPYMFKVTGSGELTIEDLDIEYSSSDRVIWLDGNKSVLNFNSGSILATKGENNTKSKIYGIWVSTGATANINGGSITVDAGPDATAVAIFGNYTNTVNVTGGKISTSGKNYSYAIHVDGDVTVTGGEIVTNEKQYGYSSGVTYGFNYAINSKGTVVISGGEITTNGYQGYLVNAGGSNQEVEISNVEFENVLSEADKTVGGHSEPNLVKGSNVTVEITGGSFEGVNEQLVKGTGSTATVSGGSFSAIKADYVETGATVTVAGKEMTKAEDGTLEEVPCVAEVDGVGFTTVLEALAYAIDNSKAEVKILTNTRELMPTDVELIINADLTLTADAPVEVKFYNDGTTYDFIINSNNNNTFTIAENVSFILEDRTIWLGYYGNNVDVVVDGTLKAGYQLWVGADLTVSETGTVISAGEALVIRRGATIDVDGGKLEASYFSVLAGNIEATNGAEITSGPLWISNNGGYAYEGNVNITIKDSTFTSTGNIKSSSTHADGVNITFDNSTASFSGTEHGASQIGENTTVAVTNASNVSLKNVSNNGTIVISEGVTLGASSEIANVTTDAAGKDVVYDGENDKYIFVDLPVASINGVGFATIEEALAAAVAGDTVIILAGDYTADINIDEAITVVGEGTVNITGMLNVTADGATVKNLNFDNGSGTAGIINAGGVLIEGCTFVAANGFDLCYTSGLVTIKDSTITGNKTYGVRFLGNVGGEVLIDNCVITGWSSFAASLANVTIKNSTFAEGLVNKILLYTSVDFIDCVFNPKMNIAYGTNNCKTTYDGCTVSDGSSLLNVINLIDIVEKNITVEVDEEEVIVEAMIGNKIYLSFQDALAAAVDGEKIDLIVDITVSEKIVINKNITLNGNGKKITYTGSDRAIDVPNTAANANVTIENLTIDFTSGYSERGINYNTNGTLTLDNVTINGEDVTYAVNFPASSNGAQAVINNSVIIGKIALNVWGKDMIITATDTAFTSVDNVAAENYAAVKLNNNSTISAEGTVITINGGSITALDENGNPSSAATNATATGVINISDTTVVEGDINAIVAIVIYNGYDQFYGCFSLQAAIDRAANDANATVKLLKDVTASEIIAINGAVTIDLNGYTVTSTAKKAFEVYADATIKNGTIIGANRCVDTRKAVALTLEDVTLVADKYSSVYGNQQPLTIGGSENGTVVTMNNVTINAGTQGYAIISFVETELTATDSTISGYCALYVKAGSENSSFNFVSSELISDLTGNDVAGNAFAAIVNDTSDITITVDADSAITTKGNNSYLVDTATFDNVVIKVPAEYADELVAAGYATGEVDETTGLVTVEEKKVYVAQIGSVQYETLQAAINAAVKDDVITLLTDVSEDVTIKKSITLNGAGFKFTGNITISGDYDVVIENVKFVKGYISDTGVVNKTASLTVKGCSFADGGYAITTATVKDLIVENCTVTNQSLIYAKKTTTNINVKDVTVSGGNYGAHIVYGTRATFENVTMTNMRYGIMTQNYGAKTLTLKNCAISAETPIYVWAKKTATDTYKFEGENTISALANDQYANYVISDKDAKLVAPEGLTVSSGVEGYMVKYVDGAYVLVQALAKVGDAYYETIQEAINAAADGDTIYINADAELVWDGVTKVDGRYTAIALVEGKSVVIDLNGKNLTVDTDKMSEMLFAVIAVDNGGKVTLNATNGGSISVSGDAKAYCLLMAYESGVEMTVNGGTYSLENASDSLIYFGSRTDRTVCISGGNFTLGNVGTGSNGSPWIFNVSGQNHNAVLVRGGTYNANIFNQHWRHEVQMPEGEIYAIRDNGNGTYSVVEAEAYVISKVGGYDYIYGYESFAEAFANAKSGNTVGLLKDIEIDTQTFTINDGVSITFDMNGKKITVADNSTKNYELFYILGELTVTGNGTIELTSANNRYWNAMSAIFHNRGGVLTIENGTFTNLGGTDMAWVVDNSGNWYGDAVTNIYDGTLTSTYTAIRNRMEQNTHGASGKATLNVYGGTINGTTSAIWAQAASESTVAPATGAINIMGGNIGLINTARSEGAECMTTITGGTVAGFKGEVGELTVNGGTLESVTILAADGSPVPFVINSEGVYVLADVAIGNVGYATLAEAIAAVEAGETIVLLKDIVLENGLVIGADRDFVLDLNGKSITGTDNATGSYALITNKGKLTVTGNGTMTLVATNNRGWNAYSSVISNQVGGKLVVESGTIEHLGGTDMAYGIDNLTNGKGTYAETVVNGGTVKSTYRAIRQFLNGVEAQNILTVNGGTIEGANKAIWFQDPSKNANSGTLTVGANAVIKGNIYLTVTEGSTEWPVEVSITASALADGFEVLTSNIPSGYYVDNVNGTYGVAIGLKGTGTEADPYQIGSLADLILFRDSVNAGETRYNAAGVYVALTADIDMDNINWTPIGVAVYNSSYMLTNEAKVFCGIFDGNGKVLSNLKIEKYFNGGADADANLGLFGITGEGSVIKNLTITNVNILTDGRNVGAVAGVTYKGTTLANITVNGIIQITGGNNVSAVGGMTRYANVSATNITVSGNANSTINGNNIVGGIFAEIAPKAGCTFTNLAVENIAINGVGGVGGIVGLLTTGAISNVTVNDVALVGKTTWTATEGRIRLGSVAGLLGGKYSTISNATVTNVTAKNLEGEDVILPIIGANYDASSNATEAKIGDVYYATFAAAYAAAQAGDTVTLLSDLTLSQILVIDKAITLDGNGKTLTSTAGRAINVSGADGVTIKNLTINASGERAINIIQNATNVTIDNVTATADNYTVNIAASAPNAVVTINKSTLNGLCTVNVAGAGSYVEITNTTINCNDNNTTAGEAYAALCLNKDAVNGKIIANGCTINVAEGSDSIIARNGTIGGKIIIDGSEELVKNIVAIITYEGSDYYYSFYTLQSAIDYAKAGDTVTLLAPIVVAKGETLEIDLKGITVSYTSDVVGEDMITVYGNLIINDTVGGGKLTYANTDTTGSNVTVSTISVEPCGTVELNNGIVENKTVKQSGSSIYSYAIDMLTNGTLGDVSVTINGGTVYSDYMAIRQFNNGDACKNTLVVNGGYIYGARRAIQVHFKNNAAYLTITDGKVEAGDYALCLLTTSENISVTGGEFIGDIYSGVSGIISGGTFDRAVYEGYCAEGYQCVQNSDGTYGIEKKSQYFDPDQVNLDLSTDLSINFYYEASRFDGEDYFAIIQKHHESTCICEDDDVISYVPYSEWKNNGRYKQITANGIAAKEMTCDVFITIYKGTLDENNQPSEGSYALGEEYYDSIVRFVELYIYYYGLDNAARAEELKMFADMLEYGTAAQKMFGHYMIKDEKPVYASNAYDCFAELLEKHATKEVPEIKDEIDYSGDPDVYFYTTNLELENTIYYNLYFEHANLVPGADIKVEYSFTHHDGATHVYTSDRTAENVTGYFDIEFNGSKLVVSVDDLAPADLRRDVTVKVYLANELVSTIKTSVEDNCAYGIWLNEEYGEEVISNTERALYEAIMKYADSAYAFKH